MAILGSFLMECDVRRLIAMRLSYKYDIIYKKYFLDC